MFLKKFTVYENACLHHISKIKYYFLSEMCKKYNEFKKRMYFLYLVSSL